MDPNKTASLLIEYQNDFIDEPAITDSKIVTARAPIDLAAFVHAIDDLLVTA